MRILPEGDGSALFSSKARRSQYRVLAWFLAECLIGSTATGRPKSSIQVEAFRAEAQDYLRIVVPAGPLMLGEAESGRKLKFKAFSFVLDHYERAGTINSEMREQMARLESPSEDTGYTIFARDSHTRRAAQELEVSLDTIVGVIRTDSGVPLPITQRINHLIRRHNQRWDVVNGSVLPVAPFDPIEVISTVLPAVSHPKIIIEAKNFLIAPRDRASAIPWSDLLVQSFIDDLGARESDAVIIETDLGVLSEFYVGRMRNWQYAKVYDETTGEEISIPAEIADGTASPRSRLRWIREVTQLGQRKHVAVLVISQSGVIRNAGKIAEKLAPFGPTHETIPGRMLTTQGGLALPWKCSESLSLLSGGN